MRGRTLRALLALSLALALGVTAAFAFAHTHAGTTSERHCLSCRSAQTASSIPAPIHVPTHSVDPVGEVRPVVQGYGPSEARTEAPPRAPPLA